MYHILGKKNSREKIKRDVDGARENYFNFGSDLKFKATLKNGQMIYFILRFSVCH